MTRTSWPSFRWISLLLLLVLVKPEWADESLLPPAGEGTEREINPATLRALAEELIPTVEAAAGQRFSTPPILRSVPRTKLGTALVRELERQYAPLFPDRTAEEMGALMTPAAAGLLPFLVAKYSLDQREVWIVPENIAALAEWLRLPSLRSKDMLRVMLVHELVHALDDQIYHLKPLLEGATTFDQLQIHSALVEGHAQFLTARVSEGLGLRPAFVDFERALGALRLEKGREEPNFLQRQLQANIRFTYVEGRQFFEAIVSTGGPEAVARVFAHPPTEMEQILHPESYGQDNDKR